MVLYKIRILHNFYEVDLKINLLRKIQNYCNVNNTKFILMIAPSKETIYYKDFLPPLNQKTVKPDFWYKEAELFLDKNNIEYFLLHDEFKNKYKSSEHDLYFSDDHHWSYYGASFASDLLLKKLSSELNLNCLENIKIDNSTRNAVKDCSYARLLGLNLNYKITAPWSLNYTNEIYLTDSSINKTKKLSEIASWNVLQKPMAFGEAIITNKHINNNLKVLILGDSYTPYIVPYLSQNIRQTITTHYHDCYANKKAVDIPKLLKKYHPDVIIFLVYEDIFFRRDFKSNFNNIRIDNI